MPDLSESNSPALDAANATFHEAYDKTRDDARRVVPVLVVLADRLVLRNGEQRAAVDFSPELFHVIKSVVHVPLAAYIATLGAAPTPALAERTRAARASVAQRRDEPEIVQRLLAILDATLAFLDAPGDAEDFARRMGPQLLASTDDATCLQLRALDRAATTLLEKLTASERAEAHVVVAGAHQARARSLGMQYFAKVLGEDAAALRLAYAESVETEDEAVQLVGTRRVDRAIGHAFFGDAERLQRDVLGDSAKSRLQDFTPEASGRLA